MIDRDIPVVLAANSIKLYYKKDTETYCPKLYQNDTWNFKTYDFSEWAEVLQSHYVTVTGVMEDEIMDKILLRVSSWGKKYYIDYDQYIEYMEKYGAFGSIATNIVYITVKQ